MKKKKPPLAATLERIAAARASLLLATKQLPVLAGELFQLEVRVEAESFQLAELVKSHRRGELDQESFSAAAAPLEESLAAGRKQAMELERLVKQTRRTVKEYRRELNHLRRELGPGELAA